jgi:hypothetical protein
MRVPAPIMVSRVDPRSIVVLGPTSRAGHGRYRWTRHSFAPKPPVIASGNIRNWRLRDATVLPYRTRSREAMRHWFVPPVVVPAVIVGAIIILVICRALS